MLAGKGACTVMALASGIYCQLGALCFPPPPADIGVQGLGFTGEEMETVNLRNLATATQL